MTLFSGLYSRKHILDHHDPLGRTVYWSLFKNSINCHFVRLHECTVLRTRKNAICYTLSQTETVFVDCYPRRLYMISLTATDPIWDGEYILAAAQPRHFQPVVVETTFADDPTSPEELEDLHLKRVLEFFIPALIWGYTELKKIIIRDNLEIKTLKRNNAGQWYLLEHPEENAPKIMPVSGDDKMQRRFVHGTAFDARSNDYWKCTDNPKLHSGDIDYDEIIWKDEVRFEKERKELEEARLWKAKWTKGFIYPPTAEVVNSQAQFERNLKETSRPWTEDCWKTGLEKRAKNLYHRRVSTHIIQVQCFADFVPLGMGTAAAAPEDLNISNAEKQLALDGKNLAKAKQRRAVHNAKFNSIYRCLSILLDSDLMSYAILGNSRGRKSFNLNSEIHLPMVYTDFTIDTLGRVANFIEQSPLASPEGKETIDYQAQVDKLTKLGIDQKKDCFDDLDMIRPMEVAVNELLSGQAILQEKTPKDVQLILGYMGEVRPTAVDLE